MEELAKGCSRVQLNGNSGEAGFYKVWWEFFFTLKAASAKKFLKKEHWNGNMEDEQPYQPCDSCSVYIVVSKSVLG